MKKIIISLFIISLILGIGIFWKNEKGWNLASPNSNLKTERKNPSDFFAPKNQPKIQNQKENNKTEEKEIEKEKEAINQSREKWEKEISSLAKNKIKSMPGRIYFSAFPDFGGSEDEVSYQKIKDFENLIGRNIFWAYFSQNWNRSRKFPKKEIQEIRKAGALPFVRLMLRGTLEYTCNDKEFSLDKIIAGKFDTDFRNWAREAKKDGKKILVEFGVEQNGDWFQWSGFCNGKNPEKFKKAYRHIIDIFREVGAKNITWFFHTDIESVPKEKWNKQKNYYPGDDYIDWIGISAYGPQNEKEDYWEKFSDLIRKNKNDILEISKNKPLALLEFGVSDGNKNGNKTEWLRDAFETILNDKYLKFSAINYWHENWEERDGVYARLRVDSSPEALKIFKKYSQNQKFFPAFIKNEFQNEQEKIRPERKIKSFYNQAYIENYQADILSEILKAENSYVLIDPFGSEKIRKNILKIKEKNNIVACYISVGTGEKWCDDFQKMKVNLAKKEWSDWEGEYFVSKIDQNLISLMKKRIDKMKEWKCDFVELDNMDWADEENIKKYSLKVSNEGSRDYVKNICRYAHQKGLKCMAKSTTYDSSLFDGLTVESYTDDKNWWSEAEMKQILWAGKIGAVAHYDEKNCQQVKNFYNSIYGKKIFFICEDKNLKKYKHFERSI